MKLYSEHYERVYQFAEYGDFENFFIKLCYVTYERNFNPQLGIPLRNIIASNNKPIFKTENIDISKYKLLNVTPEIKEAGLLSVSELYGYAPNKVYITYSSEPIQRFGLQDNTASLSLSVGNPAYSLVEDTFTFYCADKKDLQVGDMVYYKCTSHYKTQPNSPMLAIFTSAYVPILEFPDDTHIKTSAFTISDGYETISKNDIASSLTLFFGRTLIRTSTTRQPLTLITNVQNHISFYEQFPELESRMIVSSGTSETNIITSSTSPSTAEYKEMIADGEFYNVQDAQVEIIFPDMFFKKTLKKVKAC